MKHMFLRSSYVLVFTAALLFTACKKGDTGPAGEKGDAGEKGATGATGATGKNGSANVIYSPWIDVTFNAVDTSFEGVIEAPKIVDSIVQKGEVKVYWNINTPAAPTIVALPYADNGLIFRLKDFLIFPIIQSGSIFLESTYNVSSRTDPNTNEKIFQYRYVIIPGGVSARTSTVNWDDYNAVKAYLGLKD
ncbi:hypothetical protein [Niastella sp. OAS944]|uniref:hypothetical protein n=1 Tax=Niastella sp. OAS944 TaxID=2664089 RepID=UPI00349317B3|nr:hypothetical protein [Chitinophagaceae bacterium OAS944]